MQTIKISEKTTSKKIQKKRGLILGSALLTVALGLIALIVLGPLDSFNNGVSA